MTDALKMDLNPQGFFPDSETVWVFDLDNTLYAASSDLFSDIDARMGQFIADHFQVSIEEAHDIRFRFFISHGTTLRGLMDEHGMEPGRFLDYVHDIDISVIGVDHEMKQAVGALPGRKYIFTNATTRHAERILDRLGMADHFSGIYDIAAADFIPKPNEIPYRQMLDQFGIRAERAVMVEDMARNLKPAYGLGMTTVWLDTGSDWGAEGHCGSFIHHETDNLADWLNRIVDTRTRQHV